MPKRKELPKLSFKHRPYQREGIRLGIDLTQSMPDKLHLMSAPTGTGKSLVILELLRSIPNSIVVTPRVEIIADMLEKCRIYPDNLQDVVTWGSDYGLFTPIRLRNLLAAGKLPWQPSVVIWDEVHHLLANSWQDIIMYANSITGIGLTATPWRGTPKETKTFREMWATYNPLLTLKDAVDSGFCAFPSVQLWPLLDDDLIDVTNGELSHSQTSKRATDNIQQIIQNIQSERWYSHSRRTWDRSTMFAVPSTDCVHTLVAELNKQSMRAVGVTQASTRTERKRAFDLVKGEEAALVQIDVVSEGVDLPIRRLIDLKPTLSPVKWLQQVGRIMRPVAEGEEQPEYICTCRNLERHCYLMEGLFPRDTIVEAQEMFNDEAKGIPGYSKRSGSRAIGLEGLGKFVTTPIHALSGLTYFAYNLVHVDGFTRKEYFILLNPGEAETLKCERVSTAKPKSDGEYYTKYDWGKWRVVDTIPDLKGCQSAKPRDLTPNQQQWWLSAAESYGLNPHREVNERSFQVLPLLKDIRVVL